MANPDAIRDAARALSREFRAHVDEIKCKVPNDEVGFKQHQDLVGLLEKMAAGLAELADVLENASEAEEGSSKQIFIGQAAKIAEQLSIGLMEWLKQNRTNVFDYPFKIGLFGAGAIFLAHIGVPVNAFTGFLAGLLGVKLQSKK